MSRIGQMIGGGGAAAAAFLLLVGSPNWSPSFGDPFAGSPDDGPTTSEPSDDPSDDPSDVPDDESGCDPNPGRVVADYLYGQGFEKRDFIVGASVIDWDQLNTGHTRYSFSESLQSESAVRTFLSGDNRAARSARDVAGTADDYVPVQFNQGIRYADNWFWNGRKAIKGGDKHVRSGGDVWWIALDSDCKVSEEASIRAICGNPGVYWLRPADDPRD